MTHAQLIATVELATSVQQLCEQCTAGPWSVEEPGERRRLKVVSPEPWRKRPPASAGFAAEEYSDIAEVCGGKSDEARANTEMLALSRDAMPALAKAVSKMAALIVKHDVLPEAGTVPDVPLPADLGAARTTDAVNAFYAALADAFDGLLTAAGYGEVSDRNANPFSRLLTGDGLAGDGRDLRWEVLAAVLAVLDKDGDEARMKKLPQQFRVAAKARPQRQDFYDAIPESIRMGLRGEPTMATDEEVMRELSK